MPPRRKPRSRPRFRIAARADPSVHLQPFLHYLDAECGMSRNTLTAYRADLVRFFDWNKSFGQASIRRIDLKTLTDYLAHLNERELASTTIARNLASIKMFFRYLILEGVLAESTVELLSSPKLWQHLPKVLSPELVNRLLSTPDGSDRYPLRDRALLAVMYATGCRASEVASLELRDINPHDRYCRCTGKGNKERIVSLNAVALKALDDYLQHERTAMVGPRDTDRLFVTRSGRALSRITVWKIVKRYAARIGCSRDVSPHTLRHSFATHMLAGGAEIRALQELLGHASIRTTQVYTHVEHSRLKAIHERCHPRG